MSTIENLVVSAKLDSNQYKAGAAQVIDATKKMKDGLKFNKSVDGLKNVSDAARRVDLSSMARNVEALNGRFTTFRTIAMGALSNIASSAIVSGAKLLHSFAVEPIKDGFQEYELKLNSIQTVLANTARYGTSLKTVNQKLNDLNTYADKTIYNFAEMTHNVGLFTNAGMRVEDATAVIKGFSNEAAASGTNATGAANAAYQLSQALSAGKVMLMDWRSLQNVGMGNKNMQNGLLEVAEAMGKVQKGGAKAKAIQKDFNGSLKDGWLTADVMTNYLKIMGNEMSVSQMKSLGLSATQIKAFRAQAKTAEDAATKVRSFTQLVGTVKEAIGSGWAETFELLIGDFNQATDLWTGVSNHLGNLIGGIANARNNFLKDFVNAGGRDAILGTIGNILQPIQVVLSAIGRAFRNVFKPLQGAQAAGVFKFFETLTSHLRLTAKTGTAIEKVFTVLFRVIHLPIDALKLLFTVVKSVFNGIKTSVEFVIDVFKKFGDAVKFIFQPIFQAKSVQEAYHKVLQNGSVVVDSFRNAIDKIKNSLPSFNAILDKTKVGFENLKDLVTKAAAAMPFLSQAMGFVERNAQRIGERVIDIAGVTARELPKQIKSFAEHEHIVERSRAAYEVLHRVAGNSLSGLSSYLGTAKQKASEYASVAVLAFKRVQQSSIAQRIATMQLPSVFQSISKAMSGFTGTIKVKAPEISSAAVDRMQIAYEALKVKVAEYAAVVEHRLPTAHQVLDAGRIKLEEFRLALAILEARFPTFSAAVTAASAKIRDLMGQAFEFIEGKLATFSVSMATTSDIAQIKFGDALGIAKGKLQSLASTFSEVALAARTKLGQAIGFVVRQYNALRGVVGNAGAMGKAKAIEGYQSGLSKLQQSLSVAKIKMEVLSAYADKVAASVKRGASKINATFGSAAKSAAVSVRSAAARTSASIKAMGGLEGVFDKVASKVRTVWASVASFGTKIKTVLTNAFAGFKQVDYRGLFNAATLSMVLVQVRNFTKTLSGAVEGTNKIKSSVAKTIGSVGDSIGAFQKSVKADALMTISKAVAIFAASLILLSLIKTNNLMTTVTVLFIASKMLPAVMDSLKGLTAATVSPTKLLGVAVAVMAVSIAITVMAGAVKKMAGIDLKGMESALLGLFGVITALSFFMNKTDLSGSSVRNALGLMVLGGALYVFAGAVQKMGSIPVDTLKVGLPVMAALLAMIGYFTRIVKTDKVLSVSIAIAVLSLSLRSMAGTLAQYGALPMAVIVKGMGSLALVLGAYALAVKLIPKDASTKALAISTSMLLVVVALKSLGSLPFEMLLKGTTTLIAVMTALALASRIMSGNLSGAAAIVLMATALNMLVIPITLLGQLSWESIAKGLVAIAGAMVIMGGSAALLGLLGPSLMTAGAALLLIGVASLTAGAGMLMFAQAMVLAGTASAAGAVGIGLFLAKIIEAIPALGGAIGQMLANLFTQLAASTPRLLQALQEMLQATLLFINNNAGPLINTAVDLITKLLAAIVALTPRVVTAGFQILMALLKGIRDHIGGVLKVATDIIIKLVQGIGEGAARIVVAAMQTILKFINAMTRAVTIYGPQIRKAVLMLAFSIITTLAFGLNPQKALNKIKELGHKLSAGLHAAISGAKHVAGSAKDIIAHMASQLSPSRVINKIRSLGTSMRNGISNAINSAKNVVRGAQSIGADMINGVVVGIRSKASSLANSARNAVSNALSAAKHAILSHSPSKRFRDEVGKSMIDGVIVGINENSANLNKTIRGSAVGALDEMRNAMSGANIDLDDMTVNPTITPVLDLSLVERDARGINGLVSRNLAMSVGSQIGRKTEIPQSGSNNQNGSSITNLNYTQNNYSPKTLSAIEIYRNTRRQIIESQGVFAGR